ncbi:uncharacterized protein [Dysidea avara]|uniref:uncharacterized protein n=1 Tax=Dysidea avara TaxID=196820 RepID=UPI00331FAEA7
MAEGSVHYSILFTGVTGSGKSSACNFICKTDKFPTGSGLISVTTQSHAAITTLGQYTARIIDSPGFCDDHVSDEEHMKELGHGVMLAREGVHAIGLVLRADNRFTGAEATMLREMENFGELWPYIFILFTRARQLGADDGTQRYQIKEFLRNPRCPDSLKVLMRRVNDRYIMLESVDSMGDDYHQIKCAELVGKVQQIFSNTGKAYTNVLFDHALQLYEKAKKDEMDKEQALIRARQDVENLGNQLMATMKSSQEAQEQQQRIFQQALDKFQGELDAARRQNAQLAASIGKGQGGESRGFWNNVVAAIVPPIVTRFVKSCTIQ